MILVIKVEKNDGDDVYKSIVSNSNIGLIKNIVVFSEYNDLKISKIKKVSYLNRKDYDNDEVLNYVRKRYNGDFIIFSNSHYLFNDDILSECKKIINQKPDHIIRNKSFYFFYRSQSPFLKFKIIRFIDFDDINKLNEKINRSLSTHTKKTRSKKTTTQNIERKNIIIKPKIEIKDPELSTSDYLIEDRYSFLDELLTDNKIKIDRKQALVNLIELDQLFRNNNVEYWITCGTLLGFYRDNDFISHDTDVDICVNADTFNGYVLKRIQGLGFELIRNFGLVDDGMEFSFKRNKTKIDIFLFYKKENKWYNSVYSDFTQDDYLKHDYIYKPFDLSDHIFFNHKFKAPSDIKEFLSEHYGDDFMIKKEKWLYYESPKNLVTDKRIGISDSNLSIIEASEFDKYKFYISNLTIIIKSFMRKSCVDNLIRSIRKFYNDIKIIIVDDSKETLNFDYDDNIKTYNIDFDSGLSYGRNFAVSKVQTEYVLLLDDDFGFTENTDLISWMNIMIESNLDILGADVILNDHKMKFFYNLEIIDNDLFYKNEYYFKLDDYQVCDLILNFFIAKTDILKKYKWNNNLKLAEHTAFFLEHKGKIKVGHTDRISIDHQRITDEDYNSYRSRATMFLNKWMNEKGIKRIVKPDNIYTPKDTHRNYWFEFYENDVVTKKESNFALFTLNYLKENKIDNINLVDIGCGNGRDSIFFSSNGINTTGVDLFSNLENSDNFNFIKQDLTKIDYPEFNVIYLRFIVHTLKEEELNVLLDKLYNTKSLIFIETRSSKEITDCDKSETYFKSSIGDVHFRMLYSEEYLTNKIKENFNIIYKQESNNVAIYKDDNPYCIRYILSSKKLS